MNQFPGEFKTKKGKIPGQKLSCRQYDGSTDIV